MANAPKQLVKEKACLIAKPRSESRGKHGLPAGPQVLSAWVELNGSNRTAKRTVVHNHKISLTHQVCVEVLHCVPGNFAKGDRVQGCGVIFFCIPVEGGDSKVNSFFCAGLKECRFQD